MIPVAAGVRIWIATGHTDMRKGMQGLALLVQEGLGRDPFAGDVFVFRGRGGSLIKAVWHDGIGLSLYAKRLDRGRFVWPVTVDGVVALNFYGTYYILKYGPRHMRDGGSIVTTASVAGLQQNEGFFDYSATKAATISMTKTAAVELGLRGIRCNSVAPGPVRTPMLPPGHVLNTLAKHLSALGRIAEVDDLVGVYHFLASDQSRYITGHTLVVDGGRLTGYRQEVLGRLAN